MIILRRRIPRQVLPTNREAKAVKVVSILLALTAGARIMHQSSALVDQEVLDGLRPQKEKGAKVKAKVTAIMLVSPYRRSFQICWAG